MSNKLALNFLLVRRTLGENICLSCLKYNLSRAPGQVIFLPLDSMVLLIVMPIFCKLQDMNPKPCYRIHRADLSLWYLWMWSTTIKSTTIHFIVLVWPKWDLFPDTSHLEGMFWNNAIGVEYSENNSLPSCLQIWTLASTIIVFDLIGAWGAYVNLFSTTSAKRSSSGQ